MRWHIVSLLLAAVTGCFAQENELWLVWMSHTNAAADHAVIAKDCEAFRTKAPGNPLAIIAQELEAWHLLHAGKTNEATQLLEPMAGLSGSALQKAGAEIARSWLTRLDREKVRAALKRVYLRDVEFPVTLEAVKTLKKATLPPLTDRWGEPWSYRPTDIPTIKGALRQRYILESKRLGADSDLSQALTVPYASRITMEPRRILGGEGVGETIEFLSGSRKSAALTEGAEVEGVTFAFLGKSIVVLADRDHWRVFQKPPK